MSPPSKRPKSFEASRTKTRLYQFIWSWCCQRHRRSHRRFIDHGNLERHLCINFSRHTTKRLRLCGNNASRRRTAIGAAFCGGCVFVGGPATSDSFEGAPKRTIVDTVVNRYLDCGTRESGFARLRCEDCHDEKLLSFSAVVAI